MWWELNIHSQHFHYPYKKNTLEVANSEHSLHCGIFYSCYQCDTDKLQSSDAQRFIQAARALQ